MKQSNGESTMIYAARRKWLCRITLILLSIMIIYVISRPSYNYAHWIPHSFLRDIGVSHASMLWAERNADSLLHFLGGLSLTLLLSGAMIAKISLPRIRPVICVIILCVAGEALQFAIGRGVQSSDLLLGILGSFMAYLTINK